MSQREQKDIFAANLNRYMSENEKNQIDLAKDLNLSAQIVNNWVNAKSLPRMDKIEMLARYNLRRKKRRTAFNCPPSGSESF